MSQIEIFLSSRSKGKLSMSSLCLIGSFILTTELLISKESGMFGFDFNPYPGIHFGMLGWKLHFKTLEMSKLSCPNSTTKKARQMVTPHRLFKLPPLLQRTEQAIFPVTLSSLLSRVSWSSSLGALASIKLGFLLIQFDLVWFRLLRWQKLIGSKKTSQSVTSVSLHWWLCYANTWQSRSFILRWGRLLLSFFVHDMYAQMLTLISA